MPEPAKTQDTVLNGMPEKAAEEPEQKPSNEEKSKIPSFLSPLAIATGVFLMLKEGATTGAISPVAGLGMGLIAAGVTLSNAQASKSLEFNRERPEERAQRLAEEKHIGQPAKKKGIKIS